MTRPAERSRIATAALAGVLAFVITLEWRAQDASSHAVEGRRAELAAAVASRQEQSAELEKRLQKLRADIDALAASAGRGTLQRLHDEAARLGPGAGLGAMDGPGIVVSLSDATGDNASADSRIQDVDVQAVLNALWTAGAEAIAVNGERVVATTAVRNAGQAVLVNYHVLSSPYRVTAIGPPALASRFEGSDVARRFRGWQEIYGLGFAVRNEDAVSVPAYAGGVRVRYARPRGEG